MINKDVDSFFKKNNRTPLVGLLGITFKPDIDDLRNTALSIKNFKKINAVVVEPNLEVSDKFELHELKHAQRDCDLLYILVAHSIFINNRDNFDQDKTIDFTAGTRLGHEDLLQLM